MLASGAQKEDRKDKKEEEVERCASAIAKFQSAASDRSAVENEPEPAGESVTGPPMVRGTHLGRAGYSVDTGGVFGSGWGNLMSAPGNNIVGVGEVEGA